MSSVAVFTSGSGSWIFFFVRSISRVRVLFFFSLFVFCFSAGCSKSSSQVDSVLSSASAIRILPSLPRVTTLNFEPGDRIGLSVVHASGFHARNALLTYDGTSFSGSLTWYSQSDAPATLRAYYPYCASGFPQRFALLADQRAGYASCDLLGAVKEEVVPGTEAVPMLFRHLMVRLNILIADLAERSVRDVTIGGLICQADIDARTLEATAVPDAECQDIQACEEDPGSRYGAILVPQRADLQVRVTLDDGTCHAKTFPQVLLLGGSRYDLTVDTREQELSMQLNGQIADWTDGGNLEAGAEPAPDGMLLYAGERYRTVEVDGALWMAENLRYKPDRQDYGQGYWYPQGDEANVALQGMLYDRKTALGESAATTRTDGTPIRGICPPDWHIPDHTELEALACNELGSEFYCCAGYWITGGLEDKFASLNRGLLMSTSCTDEAKVICLYYTQPSYKTSILEVPQEYGISIRCVKN